jgi:enamine deaminase RidA (YjgF/YER057c/UK114 family)
MRLCKSAVEPLIRAMSPSHSSGLGYSHVVEVTGPGRTVYFAGQLGIDKSGNMGANAREQIEIAFENVKAALASVGASFEQVVKLNNYVVDIGTNLAVLQKPQHRATR